MSIEDLSGPKRRKSMRRRVLFVDDEKQITRGIRTALRKEPYEICIANSGEEALAMIDQKTVDVVVSDEEMPGMRGSEFLSIVRERHPDTIRLVLTGQASIDAAVEAINEAAVYRFLMKPCAPEDLATVVGEALDEREQRDRYETWRQSEPGTVRARKEMLFGRVLNSIWMAYQPIVSAATGKVFAYEALLRTDDEEISGPGAVLSLAEELGTVAELDRFIRHAVAQELASDPGATILVNVHPRSLEEKSLFSDQDPLRQHASRVVLEITERQSIESADQLRDKIAKLRAHGYRIAVDDLGAGYSGLTSISMLVPDIVKFDMELIRDIHTSDTKAKLVGAMTSLCKELGILTIAEGVESSLEHETVLEVGCDLLQGFLYALPARELGDRGVKLV